MSEKERIYIALAVFAAALAGYLLREYAFHAALVFQRIKMLWKRKWLNR